MHSEVEDYLDALAWNDGLEVVATLKEGPGERTELVSAPSEDPGSPSGRLIRKVISNELGLGGEYLRICKAQKSGMRFGHLPTIHDCFPTEDSQTILMECIDGETLADAVFTANPSPDLARQLFPQICDAVAELHERFMPPIIHRDLKPSNIMVDRCGRAVIIDFGIARTYKGDSDGDTLHFGTPNYAPPEQFGYGETDERSDVYALGMLLYYCLTERTPTGRLPKEGFSEPDVPEALRPVLAKATSFDPNDRYQSARELKEAFLAAMPKPVANRDERPEIQLPPPAVPPVNPLPAVPPVNPLPASPAKTKPKACLKWMDKWPKWAGWLWNVLIILVVLLLAGGAISASFNPTEANETIPLAIRLIVYSLWAIVAPILTGFLLLDKRAFIGKLGALERLSGKVLAAICLGGSALATTLAFVIYFVAYALSGAG